MSKKRRYWIAGGLLAVLLIVGLVALELVSLSALEEPGAVETYLATKAKRFLIGRAASDAIPPEPEISPAGLAIGQGQFIALCSSCHGFDGRTPSDIGQRMYPRVVDLGSVQVQQYADEELFWIIRNGIRLTGMPGLGDTQSEETIWRIAQFVRTLKDSPPDE
jgi:mono/diheme cytochrome c family protein